MKKVTINIDEHLNKLGVKKLKDHQKTIINSFLRKKDTLGILPTGYGKSLCYILPHLMKNINVIIISPLLSLMEDQYCKLVKKEINCMLFNSNHKLNMETLGEIYRKEKSYIMYFSPESLMIHQDFIRAMIKKKAIGLFAIDESHCISMWSDFRNNYKSLDNIKHWIGKKKIPILALTATATRQIEEDIIMNLQLSSPKIVRASVYKSNIIINIHEKNGIGNDIDDIYNKIQNINKKTLIYCKTRNDTERICSRLSKKGIKCAYFHAGLSGKKRNEIQENFKNSKIRVLIATVAFGMGVDIPDIYMIIHYGLPKDIESYYQEIGRGGRDGKNVYCHLYWGKKDQSTNQYFISTISDVKLRDKQLEKSILIEKFVDSTNCRMKEICKYFDCELKEKCKKCDNCNAVFRDTTFDNFIVSKKKTTSVNEKELRYILQTYREASSGLGIVMTTLILSGSKSKKLGLFYRSLSTYGSMKGIKQDIIKSKIKKVLYQNYLNVYNIISGKASYYKINEKGTEFLK